MKKLAAILKQPPVFLNDFDSKENVLEAFEEKSDANILFASYGCEGYEGSAWVLFEKDGELWEVNGGHCSCYGLEDQWSPEKVLLKELQNRVEKGDFGDDDYSGNEFKNELATFLGITLQNEKIN